MEIVEGSQVTITFDSSRCIHSRNCVLNRPDVFVPGAVGGWILPDAATPAAAIEIGHNCPSGAIRVAMNDGSATSDTAPLVNTVRVRENGPLAIEGELVLRGVPQPHARATLCRCGASMNKPWCDGSHTAAGFVATAEPATKAAEALAIRNGPLKIEPQPNGSLKVIGNLEIVSGTGRTVNKVQQVWLCRCGQSRNKPYCDSSHKAAGFVAD